MSLQFRGDILGSLCAVLGPSLFLYRHILLDCTSQMDFLYILKDPRIPHSHNQETRLAGGGGI